MANHKSAKKRAIQSIKRRDHNKSYMSNVKTFIKKFQEAQKSGSDQKVTEDLFVKVQSLLHKSAQRGLIHSNKASRTIGRLSKGMVK